VCHCPPFAAINWSQSLSKLSDCPINHIHQTYTFYLRHHEWHDKDYLIWTILQRILILYRLRILSLASPLYKNETIVDNSLRKLWSQTAWWCTFFCTTLWFSRNWIRVVLVTVSHLNHKAIKPIILFKLYWLIAAVMWFVCCRWAISSACRRPRHKSLLKTTRLTTELHCTL